MTKGQEPGHVIRSFHNNGNVTAAAAAAAAAAWL